MTASYVITILLLFASFHRFNAVVKRNEVMKHQYANRNHNDGSSIHDVTPQPGYSQRNTYSQNRSKSTLYGPDVEFSVNHAGKFENVGNSF